ncbi:hypothetical protein C8A01DRAFT_17099 [Parachaetomium inaequale]|uniref:Uncharacterized protein n=1 Tax=Parachaetomium inaequale TaxID=2588326 RepID=A0AAN6PHV7_9PEZI|nr:hypothetical protein C8A01DRAFT_17099 [Parachaetomium inaequale]
MEGQTHQQGTYGSNNRPVRPPYARSRSHGFNANADDDTQNEIIGPGQGNDRVPRRLSHLRASSYTPHVRSSSRTSWDGRVHHDVPLPAGRTPSPSPPQSPARRSNRPRPLSAISLPDHAFSRPTVLADRWSYDRERMPSSPHSSRPGTPVSDHEAFEIAFSRPASTFIESRPSSRPQSILLSASTDLGYSHTPSTPTLRLIPPPDSDRESQRLGKPQDRQSYHLLTSEEMEMLSRPPPLHPPMTASPPPTPSPAPSPGAPTPKLTNEISRLGPPIQRGQDYTQPDDGNEKDKARCMGLCEIAPARQIGGRFGAWFMGMVTPITFGLVSACVATVAGCR